MMRALSQGGGRYRQGERFEGLRRVSIAGWTRGGRSSDDFSLGNRVENGETHWKPGSEGWHLWAWWVSCLCLGRESWQATEKNSSMVEYILYQIRSQWYKLTLKKCYQNLHLNVLFHICFPFWQVRRFLEEEVYPLLKPYEHVMKVKAELSL